MVLYNNFIMNIVIVNFPFILIYKSSMLLSKMVLKTKFDFFFQTPTLSVASVYWYIKADDNSQ